MVKRVGGLTFWRIGRLGGSIYLKRKLVIDSPLSYRETLESYDPIGNNRGRKLLLTGAIRVGAFIAGAISQAY